MEVPWQLESALDESSHGDYPYESLLVDEMAKLYAFESTTRAMAFWATLDTTHASRRLEVGELEILESLYKLAVNLPLELLARCCDLIQFEMIL